MNSEGKLNNSPFFSVIVVDYEGTVRRNDFLRIMQCLADQTCKDFEVLVYHDGPKSVPYQQEVDGFPIHDRTRFFVTEERENCWGHSNRDRGIRAAKGEWIIHTNADNILYPYAIEELKAVATGQGAAFQPLPTKKNHVPKPLRKWISPKPKKPKETLLKCIIVFPIIRRGVTPLSQGLLNIRGRPEDFAIAFTGLPVKRLNIDAMQFVMRRELWLNEGGWYDMRTQGDGYMYEKFAKKYPVHPVLKILGEHW